MIFAFLFPLSPLFVTGPFGYQDIYVTIDATVVFMKNDLFYFIDSFYFTTLFHES